MPDSELPPDAPKAFHVLKAAIDEARKDAKAARDHAERVHGAVGTLSTQILHLTQSVTPIGKLQQVLFIAALSVAVTLATVALAR